MPSILAIIKRWNPQSSFSQIGSFLTLHLYRYGLEHLLFDTVHCLMFCICWLASQLFWMEWSMHRLTALSVLSCNASLRHAENTWHSSSATSLAHKIISFQFDFITKSHSHRQTTRKVGLLPSCDDGADADSHSEKLPTLRMQLVSQPI